MYIKKDKKSRKDLDLDQINLIFRKIEFCFFFFFVGPFSRNIRLANDLAITIEQTAFL